MAEKLKVDGLIHGEIIESHKSKRSERDFVKFYIVKQADEYCVQKVQVTGPKEMTKTKNLDEVKEDFEELCKIEDFYVSLLPRHGEEGAIEIMWGIQKELDKNETK